MVIYEVVCRAYIDTESNKTRCEVLRRFTKEEDAKKFKQDFEDLWQVHFDDKTIIYPCWIYCEKELSINEVKVDESYQ